jgi:CheY-like chemotaxis protein
MTNPAHRTILLVEDNADDILLIRRALVKSGIINPLSIVNDGDQAVAYLERRPPFDDPSRSPSPALVLLDLKLPRRSGLEVLDWIRQEPSVRRIPVVVLTSSREPADVGRAYDRGANSYLVKPVDFDGLREMIALVGDYWLLRNEPPAPTDLGTPIA